MSNTTSARVGLSSGGCGMTEFVKATRLMLLAELRGVTVTHVDFEGPDGLRIDADLAQAAGLLEHEKVDVHVLSSGTRFACRIRCTLNGSHEVAATGATAHLVKPGDTVALAAFGWMKAKAAAKHSPVVVELGADNALPPARKVK